MIYKKLFFPIGGGNELKERLYGGLLIAKFFNTKLEILKSGLKTDFDIYKTYDIPDDILKEMKQILNNKIEDENKEFIEIFKEVTKELDLDFSLNNDSLNKLVNLTIKDGLRSELIEQESKYCDLVIAAAPPQGITTATFQTAVTKSGKPVLMFPRKMKKFKIDSVIIGWDNSTESSRAVTSSIRILKYAQRVHIVTSNEYINNDKTIIKNLIKYLKEHNINASYKIMKTTKTPGEALLNTALDGDFDLIIAGAYNNNGLKRLMLGGASGYILENSDIPIFMSH